MGGGWRDSQGSCFWGMENFPLKMGGMEKDVCTLCVILMEDGWKPWVSCVALLLYQVWEVE